MGVRIYMNHLKEQFNGMDLSTKKKKKKKHQNLQDNAIIYS